MKKKNLIQKVALPFTLWWGSVTPLWAAGNREDNSDLFVWIFLSLCALIVVAQLIPALMVLMGFAKGIKKETPRTVTETANTLPTQDK